MERNVQMKKRILAFLLVFFVFFDVIPVPVSAAESYDQHFQSSEEKLLDQYYGTTLDGLGEHAAILTSDQDQTFQADVDSALLVDATKDEVLASFHALKKVYPASTTKVLTALITLENCKLTDEVTLKSDITFHESGVVAVGFKKCDKVKIEGLLNALLVESANDAAVALAEHIAGSSKAFAGMMNQRAKELGATHCNFVTSNGLHNKDHYVTAYDMYLIFKEAIKHDAFLNIVKKANYTLEYETAAGTPMYLPMETTNHYITGEYALPDNIYMIGGKTGTTGQAGSCLVILTEDNKGEQYISLVYHGATKDILYNTMTDLLEKTHK